MQTMVPQGGEAVSAWRSLTPQARAAAWAAARQGAAPPDAGLGLVCAGYGQTMARRYLVFSVTLPLVALVATAALMVALVLARATPTEFGAVALVVILPYYAGVVALRLRRTRYRQLHSCGLLAVEAARAGAPDRPPAGWANPYQSDFTVPYGAYQADQRAPAAVRPSAPPGLPVAAEPPAPAKPEPPGPPAEPVVVRTRLGPTAGSLAVVAVCGAFLWLCAVFYAYQGLVVFEALLIVLACPLTVLTGWSAFLVVRVLRRPVAARFTPSGWELPRSRTAGSWSEIRQIRVRAPAGRVPLNSSSGLRYVAFIVADPGPYLDRMGGIDRIIARRRLRRFGSPLVVVASPRHTIGVVELVNLLSRYTTAPADWG
jgi:hypothetical protein